MEEIWSFPSPALKSLSYDNKNVDFYFLKWHRDELKENESKIQMDCKTRTELKGKNEYQKKPKKIHHIVIWLKQWIWNYVIVDPPIKGFGDTLFEGMWEE